MHRIFKEHCIACRGAGARSSPGAVGSTAHRCWQLLQRQRLAYAWLKHCISHYKNREGTATVRCTRQAGINSRHPDSSEKASKKVRPSLSNTTPKTSVLAACPTDNWLSPSRFSRCTQYLKSPEAARLSLWVPTLRQTVLASKRCLIMSSTQNGTCCLRRQAIRQVQARPP